MSLQLDSAKQAARRIFRRTLWGLLIGFVLLCIGYFAYSQMTYSDGFKSGQLIKISRRGIIFKTFEGSLNLSPNGMMTNWDFSAKNADIARQLETLDGHLVKVHYEQRYRVFFWQGDTEYIVDAVEKSGN